MRVRLSRAAGVGAAGALEGRNGATAVRTCMRVQRAGSTPSARPVSIRGIKAVGAVTGVSVRGTVCTRAISALLGAGRTCA